MNLKLALIFISVFFPFLTVWSCWVLTAFSFTASAIFQNPFFWFGAVLYWIAFMWIPLEEIRKHNFKAV